ncbi:hypothetical protein ABPG75_011113 [Micractinium tetrahymenae]
MGRHALIAVDFLDARLSSAAVSPAERGGLLALAAAVLRALPPLLHAPMNQHEQQPLLESASGLTLALVGSDAVARVSGSPHALSGLPSTAAALAQALVPLAARLEKPGEEGHSLTCWTCLVTMLDRLLSGNAGRDPGVCQATAAALAAQGAAARPGLQLAEALLRLLAGLAREPAAFLSGLAARWDGDSSECKQAFMTVLCWGRTAQILLAAGMETAADAVLVRSAVHRPLLPLLVGLLGRLQRHIDGSARPLSSREASGLLTVAASAAAVLGMALRAQSEACHKVSALAARAAQPAQPGAQQRLRMEQCRGAGEAVWQGVAALPAAAAVLSATACLPQRGAGAAASALCRFTLLADGVAGLFVQLITAGMYQDWQPAQAELLPAAMGAIVRCAARLAASPPASLAADVEEFANCATLACACGLSYLLCCQEAAGLQLTADAAEAWLAALAALASTACKAVVLRASAGGAVAAPCAAAQVESTEGQLLVILRDSGELGDIAARGGSGQARSRWHAQGFFNSTQPLAWQQGAEAAVSEAALAAAHRCANMGCTNLAGASDTQLPTKRCSRCRLARYCSEVCSAADWRRHRDICRLHGSANQ